MKRPHECQARQYGDQMICAACGLNWDTNDMEPPACHKVDRRTKKAKEAAASVPGTKVVVADFSQDEKSRGLTDFNDLHKARGLAAVKNAIFPEKRKEEEVER